MPIFSDAVSRGLGGLLLALSLAACGGPSTSGVPAAIEGSIRLAGTPGAARDLRLGSPPPVSTLEDFVPGELIVRFAPGLRAQDITRLDVGGVTLERVRPLALEDTGLFRVPTDRAGTMALVQSLQARPDVLYAQPNYIQRALATSNDEYRRLQWHYDAVELAQAWDIEKGTSNPVTVAVIDTGILRNHPDLQGKLLPGYDFITDPASARDGTGRDANPEDAGDAPGSQSSYHGSHVAGTIAAATNNQGGVAGISWGAKILPVRVLGAKGGTLADITDAMLWAAGIGVTGAPANANPASIINMSLGGSQPCRAVPLYTDVIQRVNARGVMIVVAAGNENIDASSMSPASCAGVITVGATDFRGARAAYSNHGKRIDVMAPGGILTKEDLNRDGYADGVLSLSRDDTTGGMTYAFNSGTSMAAPHVTGILALMKSRDPGLSSARALDLLRRTARPLSGAACSGSTSTLTGSDCGAGLVSAAAALRELSGTGSQPTPDFAVSVTPNSVQLPAGGQVELNVAVIRSGGFGGTVTSSLSGLPQGVTHTLSGSTLTLRVASTVASGTYGLTLTATSGSLTRTATITLAVGVTPTRAVIQGTVVLACAYVPLDGTCDERRSRRLVIDEGNDEGRYAFTGLQAGPYVLVAVNDLNGNEVIDDGDLYGIYMEDGDVALVEPGRSGADFTVDFVQDNSATRDDIRRLLESALR